MFANRSLLKAILYAIPILLIVASLAFAIFQPILVLPRITLSPGFSLENQFGELRTSEDYRGKLTLYTFSYTRCGQKCADYEAQVRALRDELATKKPASVELAFVTISLDPEHDKTERRNAYARLSPLSASSIFAWDYLSGTAQETKHIVGGGFGLYYNAEVPTQIEFEPRLVLVDGWGIIRAEYFGATVDITRIVEDIEFLSIEIENSDGAAKLAYEAAHLFRCYR